MWRSEIKIYTYSEARQNLASLLDSAGAEEVIITRRDGTRFKVIPIQVAEARSPFDLDDDGSLAPTRITTEEIVGVIREDGSAADPG